VAFFLFDTETTGLNPEHHEICSLAAIILDKNWKFKAKGHMNLMPDHWDRAQPEALKVNGIDPKTWKATHRSNTESIEKMYAFIDKNKRKNEKIIPVGHNVGFDTAFLKVLVKKTGHTWRFHYHEIDTISWVYLWSAITEKDVRNFSLGSCTKLFGIENDDAHTASADTFATMQLALKTINDLKVRIKSGQQGIV
jgi:DNA polymerase III alpha subunit (gram-positive type)